MSKYDYEGRHPLEIDDPRLHQLYGEHVSAMTSERLHSKAAIAVELAWRDWRIEQLESKLAAAQQGEAVGEVKCEADTYYAELYMDNPNWQLGDKLYTAPPQPVVPDGCIAVPAYELVKLRNVLNYVAHPQKSPHAQYIDDLLNQHEDT